LRPTSAALALPSAAGTGTLIGTTSFTADVGISATEVSADADGGFA